MGDGNLASSGAKPSIPLHGPRAESGIRKVVKVVDDKMLIFDPPDCHNPIHRMQRAAFGSNTKRIREHRFVFDKLFDDKASQEDVYANTTRPLLDSVLDGYNATVFAYGATGCGKTHTISGTPTEPGIIFLTMKELFERIDELKDTKNIELSLSYLEIYNETIRDLLDPHSNKQLILREDAVQRISVSNLSTHKPENVEQVMDMIIQGNQNRTMSPTEANATSSRSHAVLQINVVQKSRTAAISEAHTFATLSIIDLAGSERASATKNRGERLLEGANINKSLLALGNCINALCDPRRRNHIPYRDSKLTRLLKFSLGGNCKTVMIVCISPSSKHYDETLNTLKYADRAKKIKTKVIRNEHNLNRHVGSYLKMITEQKQEIEELRAREHSVVSMALENFKKQHTKCLQQMKESINSIQEVVQRNTEAKCQRIALLIKIKNTTSQISQLEAIISSLSALTSGGTSGGVSHIVRGLRTGVDKLIADKTQYEKTLNNTIYDIQPINSAIDTQFKKLKDTRGWDDDLTKIFQQQTQVLKLQNEADVLTKVAETNTPTTGIEILSMSLFKIISSLSTMNEASMTSGDDIKSFEIGRLIDEVSESCGMQFEAISSNTKGPSSANLGFSLSRLNNNDSSNIPTTTSFSPSLYDKDGPIRTMKRPASASSLKRDSPVRLKPIRKPSILPTHHNSTNNSNAAPQPSRPSLTSSRLSLSKASDSTISADHSFLKPTKSSSGKTPSPRLVHGSLTAKKITSPNSLGSPMRRKAAGGYTVGPAAAALLPTLKKHSVIVRSPLRNNRKAVKRVRWEDAEESDQPAEEFTVPSADADEQVKESENEPDDFSFPGPKHTPPRTSVLSPMKKSMLKAVVFNNSDDHDEDEDDDDEEINTKASGQDIVQKLGLSSAAASALDYDDMSLDSVPEIPKLSNASKEAMKSSENNDSILDMMDLDDEPPLPPKFILPQTQTARRVSSAPINKPQPTMPSNSSSSFGVKGNLRRKSSIVPNKRLSVAPGASQPLIPTPVIRIAGIETPIAPSTLGNNHQTSESTASDVNNSNASSSSSTDTKETTEGKENAIPPMQPLSTVDENSQES